MACRISQKHTASLKATGSFCHLSKPQETWVPCVVLGRLHLSTPDSFIPAQSQAFTDRLAVKFQESKYQAPSTCTKGQYLPASAWH